ncbi:hypothetical protein OB919_20575 [Halobacteria archaeon AArc-curdl1]|uniref:Uncharacterized protein n=1 Tax=Natronosalvus hydrolyticus TaxID=2979988 RepID=A0AAP2ZCB1_9EURY|nr:hypothetical protein [Halobacteria archaeon AArc-curdl1]
MSAATITRWTRAFVGVGVLWFVCWQLAVVAGFERSVTVVPGLWGFVFHVIFGKGYSLIPSYFESSLAFPYAPAVQLPLTATGTAALTLEAAGVEVLGIPLTAIGSFLWLAGCLVFVGSLAWTVRGNLLGRHTGTGCINAERVGVDRVANLFVPVVVSYLLVGAALPVVRRFVGFSTVLPPDGPATTHVLALGAATLLFFAVGFRVLPRFLAVSPRRPLVWLVLPAGALGPLLLVTDFLGLTTFLLGAVVQTVAITGFALAYIEMFHRSDRRRIGLYGVYAGVLCGVLAVGVGLTFAFEGHTLPGNPLDAHYRLALTGFLGLSIIGVTYQFYPPAIASIRGLDDQTASLSMGVIAVGVLLEAGGLLGENSSLERVGAVLVFVGALLYAAIIFAVFYRRYRRMPRGLTPGLNPIDRDTNH